MNGKDGAAQLAPSGNICISGWYGADNTGDEAILLQFIDEMTAGAAIPLTVFAADAKRGYVVHARPTVTVREHVRLVGRGAIRNLLHGRIAEQIRVLEWQKVSFLILMILVAVAAIDWISGKLRFAIIGRRAVA